MNKKISFLALAFCLAGVSADVLAGPRSRRSAGVSAPKKINSSITSGNTNKIFTKHSITLIENRAFDLSDILDTSGKDNITQGDNNSDPKYKLCIPCSDSIALETLKDGKYTAVSTGGKSCYSLPNGNAGVRLIVKENAVASCGAKIRMTINDNKAANNLLPEVDSIVVNIVSNSSVYDFGVDSDVVKAYNKAKDDAKRDCNIDMGVLDTIRGLLIASTTTSAVTIATSGADTAIRTVDNIKNFKEGNESSDTSPIASTVLSGVSVTGNTAAAVTSFISVGQIDSLISKINDCKKAAVALHNAGLELEAEIEDITSADVINVSSDEEE